MLKSFRLAGLASVAAFSSTPAVVVPTPDVSVVAESQDCDNR
jgi:hypothetical protein